MMSGRLAFALAGALLTLSSSSVFAEGEPPQYCIGEYAEDMSQLTTKARELDKQPYSYCVRNTVVYECLSYAADGSVRRTRRSGVQHGTAFAYKQDNGSTLLLTNEHVAEWPAVTPDAHTVDGVPAGCKRVSESLKHRRQRERRLRRRRRGADARGRRSAARRGGAARQGAAAGAAVEDRHARRRCTSATPSRCAASRWARSPPPTRARWSRPSSTTTRACGTTTTS